MKKRFFTRLTLILFAFGFLSSSASAIPLGSFSMTELAPDTNADEYANLKLGFTDADFVSGFGSVPDSGFFPYPSYSPFFNKNLTAFDVGFTFVANSGNYTDWDNMLNDVLMDGNQDWLSWSLDYHDPGPEYVSWSFTADYIGNGIDFQGSTIENIFITIDDLEVSSVSPESIDWIASWTVVVDGTSEPVPEPATMLLFGTGLIGLASLRHKKKKK